VLVCRVATWLEIFYKEKNGRPTFKDIRQLGNKTKINEQIKFEKERIKILIS